MDKVRYETYETNQDEVYDSMDLNPTHKKVIFWSRGVCDDKEINL